MLMVIEHPTKRVRCALDVEKVLSASGMSPEDVKRCMPTVPKELRPEVERTTVAIKAFIDAWAAAEQGSKPTLPNWIVYVHAF